jgi:site-specific recombinase XerD
MTQTPIGVPTFSTAAAAWFEDHSRYIKPSTADSYDGALGPLIRFFGDKRINEIGVVHLRMYQGQRSARVGAHTVNRELGVFQQVLREFDAWKHLESRYRQLKEPPVRAPRRAGPSLTREEEQRLREVAFSRPGWQTAAHCIVILLNTTLAFGELRQLCLCDVDVDRRCVTVREGAKNTCRERTIPLNDAARESMVWILERWKKCGGSDDEHYILPHRPRYRRAAHRSERSLWIFDQPTASIYSSFRNIRNAAGLPSLRIQDCQAMTQTNPRNEPSDIGRTQRGTGNLIGFPVQGGGHD